MFNGILFQESLQDLVKGIRANRRNEEEYIRKRVADIGEECRASDMEKKAIAVLKLTYLQMMGHSISFASFYITEVMSSPIFALKRIGYLAAAQSFSPTTDVLLLTTNQFKKDLTNGKVQDCSQALTCLGKLITEDLGRDLEHDITVLINSPRPYIRKKALLVLYKLILVHPETLPVVGSKFREMLGDSDPSVVCAAVTVTCELAKASPKNFLSLAPILYQLLTNPASNNWMLIKIVKLMGVLTPLEPRLGRKLVEPLVTLMRTTRAKSLLYECCSTVTSGLLEHPEAVELCAQHLGKFMVDSDQNLKYLGLLSMRKLIKVHPDVAMEHRDLVLDCLDDDDVGIRMRALEIVSEFLTPRNCRDLCRILLRKLRKASSNAASIINSPSESSLSPSAGPMEDASKSMVDYAIDEEAPYRDALAEQLLRPGTYLRNLNDSGAGGYEMLRTKDDFMWYFITVLAGLGSTDHLSSRISSIVADQMMDLTSRVEAIRKASVKVSLALFESHEDTSHDSGKSSVEHSSTDTVDLLSNEANGDVTVVEPPAPQRPAKITSSRPLSLPLLTCASWISGEYAKLIEDHFSALNCLIRYQLCDNADAQVAFLSAILKIYAACPDDVSIKSFELASNYIKSRVSSDFAEVQERAWLFSAILGESYSSDRSELQALFEGNLKPVDARAQEKIPVPIGLDLDKPLIDTGSDSLSTYLMRQISNVTENEFGLDEDDLFREKQFEHAAVNISRGTAIASARNTESPFFLGSGSGQLSCSEEHRGNGRDEQDPNFLKEDYIADPQTDAVAVLIPDDIPVGVDLTKMGSESQGSSSRMIQGSVGAAFEGAFPSKAKSKRKVKGKKKKKKVTDVRADAPLVEPTDTLIDLVEVAPQQGATAPSPSVPKHLADNDLLL